LELVFQENGSYYNLIYSQSNDFDTINGVKNAPPYNGLEMNQSCAYTTNLTDGIVLTIGESSARMPYEFRGISLAIENIFGIRLTFTRDYRYSYPEDKVGQTLGIVQYLDLTGRDEPYGLRLTQGLPLPPSYVDTFINDLLLNSDTPFDGKTVTKAIIMAVINKYASQPIDDLQGYRPWNHWNFIQSLDESARNQLAQEVVDYVKLYGIRAEE
jgi:hypothetical protein